MEKAERGKNGKKIGNMRAQKWNKVKHMESYNQRSVKNAKQEEGAESEQKCAMCCILLPTQEIHVHAEVSTAVKPIRGGLRAYIPSSRTSSLFTPFKDQTIVL